MRFTVRRPGRAPFYCLTLDDLIAIARIRHRLEMPISRDDLKKKRLAAMSTVGAQLDAMATMYDEVAAYGDKVAQARDAARAAHLNAMDADIADLKEMEEEMKEFAQVARPLDGVEAGAKPPAATAKPANGSAALAALNAAQPNPRQWGETEGGAPRAPQYSDRSDNS